MRLTPEKNQPEIDTIRLILTLDCNLSCSYCCNKLESVKSRFVHKSFKEINFPRYQNVCLTGGEPFLNKELLNSVLRKVPTSKNIYIYSNGLLINDSDINDLLYYCVSFNNLISFNIGLHSINQLKHINPLIDKFFPVCFLARDIYIERLLKAYPERLSLQNLKGWHLNDCDLPNEDWVLLR